jgi:hypothetical protein
MAKLGDVYIRHGINLTRYSNHEAQRLVRILDTANTQIKGIITKAKAIETKEKYRRVAAEIRRVTKECSQQLNGQIELDFKELAEEETRFVENALRTVGVTADFELPALAKVWSAASFGSYSENGHETFESYLDGLGDNLYKTWDTNVRAGYLAGLTAKQINRAVLGSVKDVDPGQMQKLRQSLERNTKTMVASLAETARNETYKANSRLFSGYRYLGVLDSRQCLVCGSRDGKRYETLEEAPTLPSHMNCVLGDTNVSTTARVSHIFRRAYKGEIIVLTTASGNVLRVTPNHPILCEAGFIPAKLIKAGDNLIVDNGLKIISFFNKGTNQKVARIEDIFRSFRESSGMVSEIVPLTPKDFHGDVTDEKVEIIRPTRELSLKRDTFFSKVFGKIFFISRAVKNIFCISTACSSTAFFKTYISTFCSKMSIMSQSCFFFLRRIFHSFNLLFFSIPLFNSVPVKIISHICSGITKPRSYPGNTNTLIVKLKNFFKIGRLDIIYSSCINPNILQSPPNSFMIDTKLSRNIINRYKRFIKVDNVLSISSIKNFSGHVYNLETKNNWFIANNIIIHNCRCLYLPIIKGMEDFDEDDERASVDGPVSANMTYEDWLKTQPDDVVRDILGPTRFEMYKNGVEISSFVADGRTLTLEQLMEVEGISQKQNSVADGISKIVPWEERHDINTEPEYENALQEQSDVWYKERPNLRVGLTDYEERMVDKFTTNNPEYFKVLNGVARGDDIQTIYNDCGIRINDIDTAKDQVSALNDGLGKYELKETTAFHRFDQKKFYQDWKVGEEHTIKQFVSTATIPQSKFSKGADDGIHFKIIVPSGNYGAYIGDNSTMWNEHEFLLRKNLKYRVIEIREGEGFNGQTYMVLEVVE